MNTFTKYLIPFTLIAAILSGCSGGSQTAAVSTAVIELVLESAAGFNRVLFEITENDSLVWSEEDTIETFPLVTYAELPGGLEYDLRVDYFLDSLFINSSYQLGILLTTGDTTTINIGGPDINVEVETYTIVGICDTPEEANDVVIIDTLIYVADGWGGLRIVDFSDPEEPVETGYYDSHGSARDVVIRENLAFIAYEQGMTIVDVGNPYAPFFTGSINTPGFAIGVDVQGDYAYVADYDRGLRMIDVSNPSLPVEAGYYDTPGTAYAVQADSPYVYIADGDSGMIILDVSFPDSIAKIGEYQVLDYNAPAYARDIELVDNLIYLAYWDAGLRIVDVSNPSNPVEVSYFDTVGYSVGVAVSSDKAYIANWAVGMWAVDVANIYAPHKSGYSDTPGYAFGVGASGDYICIADGEAGLIIIYAGSEN